jgi:hypothetical protein
MRIATTVVPSRRKEERKSPSPGAGGVGVQRLRRVEVGGGHARSPSEECIDGAEVEGASAGIGQSSDAGTEELRPPRQVDGSSRHGAFLRRHGEDAARGRR